MIDSNPGSAYTEMLLDWEGPAVVDPVALAHARTLQGYLADPGLIGGAAAWVALTLAGDNSIKNGCEAVKTNVGAFLAAWRQRHGSKKLDELKEQVLIVIRTHRGCNHLDPELEQHLNLLFRQAVE